MKYLTFYYIENSILNWHVDGIVKEVLYSSVQ